MAGLALGRASSHQRGMQRLAITALAVAAVPLANALLGRMLGSGRRQQPPAGGGRRHARTPAEREARRLRLWDAVQHAAEAAAAVGMVPPEEQELLTRVMQVRQGAKESCCCSLVGRWPGCVLPLLCASLACGVLHASVWLAVQLSGETPWCCSSGLAALRQPHGASTTITNRAYKACDL